jgi:hypothetical protein
MSFTYMCQLPAVCFLLHLLGGAESYGSLLNMTLLPLRVYHAEALRRRMHHATTVTRLLGHIE